MAETAHADREAVLAISSVTRRFGETVALRSVSLSLAPGQVHALLGANGSGKSTLVKVISGAIMPNSGSISIAGIVRPGFSSPTEAAAAGIRVIHQEAPLIDNLTVLEAVAMFRGYGARGIAPIKWRALKREVQPLLDRVDVRVKLDELCARVGPADRAGIALAITVASDRFGGKETAPTRLLLLDEVTAPIPAAQADLHLDRVRRLADEGVAVLMVTHRLGELRIADDITVLRNGEVVYHEAGGTRRSNGELIEEVVGTEPAPRTSIGGASESDEGSSDTNSGPVRQPVRRLWLAAAGDQQFAPGGPSPDRRGAAAIAVSDLSGAQLRGLSFVASAGEIVGFAGLQESGLSELTGILAGAVTPSGGTIRVGDAVLSGGCGPRGLIQAGVTVVPADRLRDGGVATLSVEENVILPALGAHWHRRTRRRALVREIIDAFDVKPRNEQALFGRLSGGNQQKVLLGKWLALRPHVLVLDDPTYGIDPAAREGIFEAIADAARLGVCVLFFSTEPEQLVRICDRVLVLRDGTIERELASVELSEDALAKWSYA